MSSLKSLINSTLEKFGTEGKMGPRPSQDPIDAIAHEYVVASTGRSYFEKRCERAKAALEAALDANAMSALLNVKNEVAENEVSSSISLMSGQFHDVTAQVKIGATFLDTAGLKVDLMKLMPTLEVDALFQKNMRRRNPSVTYVISDTIAED